MSKPTKVAQFKNVQALRGFACLTVVLDHTVHFEPKATPGSSPLMHWVVPLGFNAVDLFFAISGFVIITSTWSSFERPGIWKNYLLRRISRVFPVYWIVLIPLATLSIIAPSLVNGSQATRPDLIASFLLLPQSGLPLLSVSWSLVYEMYFYYLYAFAIARPPSNLAIYAGGFVIFTSVMALMFRNNQNPYLMFLSSTLSFEFVFGMIIGWLTLHEHRFRWCIASIIVGFAVVIIIALVHPGQGSMPFGQMRFMLSGIPAALVLYGFVGLEKDGVFVIRGILNPIGDASYSMYLWHVPIMATITHLSAHRAILRNPIVHAMWLAASVTIIVVLSLVLYRLIEKPLLGLFSALLRMKPLPAFANPTLLEPYRKEQVS